MGPAPACPPAPEELVLESVVVPCGVDESVVDEQALIARALARMAVRPMPKLFEETILRA
jgi:hypothetical protein